MALAKRCDKCGNFFEPYEGSIDGMKCNAVVTSCVAPDGDWHTRKKYDLCGDCLDSFAKWFSGHSEKEKE